MVARAVVAKIDVVESFETVRSAHADIRGSGELQIESRVDSPVLLHVVVIEIVGKKEPRPEGEQHFALGMKAAVGELLDPPNVHARNKSQLRLKTFAAIDVI
jgi:hypothetical protein